MLSAAEPVTLLHNGFLVRLVSNYTVQGILDHLNVLLQVGEGNHVLLGAFFDGSSLFVDLSLVLLSSRLDLIHDDLAELALDRALHLVKVQLLAHWLVDVVVLSLQVLLCMLNQRDVSSFDEG